MTQQPSHSECPEPWCVMPAGHKPVSEVLPIPNGQVHAASVWVRKAYLEKLEEVNSAGSTS